MAVIWKVKRELLEPEFANDVDRLLLDSPFLWRIVYGYRTLAEQDALYQKYLAGGPKAAPPGKSAHNFGLAVDVQLIMPDGSMNWNIKYPGWMWLFKAIKPTPRLHSGVSFQDYDHIERYQWKLHKNWNLPTQPATTT